MTNRRCPRCRVPLVVIEADMIGMRGCGRCGGLWLDTEDCKRLLTALPHQAIRVAGTAARAAVQVDTVADDLACPSCSGRLERTHHKRANVFIDVCPVDGTWFDAGEMDRVAMALHAGPTTVSGVGPVTRLASSDYAEADPRGPYAKGLTKIAEAAVLGFRQAAEAAGHNVTVLADELAHTPITEFIAADDD
jgi:Zn-finger nucleic acid-binding protein